MRNKKIESEEGKVRGVVKGRRQSSSQVTAAPGTAVEYIQEAHRKSGLGEGRGPHLRTEKVVILCSTTLSKGLSTLTFTTQWLPLSPYGSPGLAPVHLAGGGDGGGSF